MQLKNGKFSIEVDIQDFEPEDIDIKVQGDSIILAGRREIKRGSSSSVRQFNQKFAIPTGLDVSALTTEMTSEGMLVISAPQLEDQTAVGIIEGFEISQKGDVDIKSSSEATKTTSEAAFEVEGGHGQTKKVEDSQKKSQQSVTKRQTEDGFEEEIFEEVMEFSSSSSTTTMMTTMGGSGDMKIPMMVLGGAAGGSQTTETTSTNQNVKAKDGKILEMLMPMMLMMMMMMTTTMMMLWMMMLMRMMSMLLMIMMTMVMVMVMMMTMTMMMLMMMMMTMMMTMVIMQVTSCTPHYAWCGELGGCLGSSQTLGTVNLSISSCEQQL